jgi:hypothetical protein
MAGDLSVKHVDWNLREYLVEKSCLTFAPDTPTTKSYNPSAIHEVSEIVITKNLTSRCI